MQWSRGEMNYLKFVPWTVAVADFPENKLLLCFYSNHRCRSCRSALSPPSSPPESSDPKTEALAQFGAECHPKRKIEIIYYPLSRMMNVKTYWVRLERVNHGSYLIWDISVETDKHTLLTLLHRWNITVQWNNLRLQLNWFLNYNRKHFKGSHGCCLLLQQFKVTLIISPKY